MHMNVKPIPTLDPRINEIRALTAQIVNHDILPNESKLWAAWRDQHAPTATAQGRELRERIKEKVKQAGLWAPHLPPEYGGAGLDFLEHAYMNEVLAYASARRRSSAWSRRTPGTRRSCSSTAPRSRSGSGWSRSSRARSSPASR